MSPCSLSLDTSFRYQDFFRSPRVTACQSSVSHSPSIPLRRLVISTSSHQGYCFWPRFGSQSNSSKSLLSSQGGLEIPKWEQTCLLYTYVERETSDSDSMSYLSQLIDFLPSIPVIFPQFQGDNTQSQNTSWLCWIPPHSGVAVICVFCSLNE